MKKENGSLSNATGMLPPATTVLRVPAILIHLFCRQFVEIIYNLTLCLDYLCTV